MKASFIITHQGLAEFLPLIGFGGFLDNRTIPTFEIFHQAAENNSYSQRLIKYRKNCLQRHRPSLGVLRKPRGKKVQCTQRKRSPEWGLGLGFHPLAIFLTPRWHMSSYFLLPVGKHLTLLLDFLWAHFHTFCLG